MVKYRWCMVKSRPGSKSTLKTSQSVAFTERLDLRPLLPEASINCTKLALYAVVVHLGTSAQFGHYVSYVVGTDGIWWRYDDHKVSAVAWEQVAAHTKDVYMLFYQRIGDKQAGTQPDKAHFNISNGNEKSDFAHDDGTDSDGAESDGSVDFGIGDDVDLVFPMTRLDRWTCHCLC